jgi:probable F420-dependent oxidoreductase
MNLGLLYANVGAGVDPGGALAIARHAEAAGFESIWTVEHVVVPGAYASSYPYSETGRLPGGEDAPIPDPLIWLAFVAAHTERIRLATGVLILPQRSPLVTAKQVATLDVLSRGRVILGVGVGWLREEFEAIGVPFMGRGARTDEYIAAMRALWAQEQPSFAGTTVSFADARSWPKPVRRAVPIVIGGHSPAAARRAGRIGDGFFPGRASIDDLGPLLEEMRRAAEQAGRDPDGIEVTAPARLDAANLEALRGLGVSRVVVPTRGLDLATVIAGIDVSAERLRTAGVA